MILKLIQNFDILLEHLTILLLFMKVSKMQIYFNNYCIFRPLITPKDSKINIVFGVPIHNCKIFVTSITKRSQIAQTVLNTL